MNIAAPPPSMADLRPDHPVDGIKNSDAQSKFSSVAPMDKVTLSPAAQKIQQADDEKLQLRLREGQMESVGQLTVEEWLDKKLVDNKTAVSGVSLTRVANLTDEANMDSRLYLDSVFEFAAPQRSTIKPEGVLDDGRGVDVDLMLREALTNPALGHLNEAQARFQMNTNYDLIRMLSSKSSNEALDSYDALSPEEINSIPDRRLKEDKAGDASLPNANTAIVLKKYEQVAQSLEI